MPRESYLSTHGASKESAGGKLSHRECLAHSRMPGAKGFETPVVGGVGGSTQIQGGFILALCSAQGSSQSKAPLSGSRAPGWLHWSINQMPAALVPRTPGGMMPFPLLCTFVQCLWLQSSMETAPWSCLRD